MKKEKPSCSLCFYRGKDRRFLEIETEVTNRVFCSKCARKGYLTLSQFSNLSSDEKNLFKELAKFISD